jgi:hypothetical protein
MSRRVLLLLVVVMSVAPFAAGQKSRRAKVVEVVLEGCEESPPSIDVTLDDLSAPVHLLQVENLWSAARARTFNAYGRVASARVGGRRTDCARVDLLVTGGNPEYLAKFVLRCQKGARLRVFPNPELPVSWVRVIHSDQSGKVCLDPSTGASVPNVVTASDDVYLHFGPAENLAYSEYHLKVLRGTLAREPVVIGKQKLVNEYCVRRSNCAPDQLDIFEKFHLDRRFQKVELRSEP